MDGWQLPEFASHTYVEQDAKVRNGSPCVAGTGLRVFYIGEAMRRGMTPEQMASEYGIPLPAVLGALAFYLDNQDALEQEERGREAWGAAFLMQERARASA